MAGMFAETDGKSREKEEREQFLANIENFLVNGDSLILDHIFNRIDFDKIEDDVYRKLVIARLSCPSSKAATVEYLMNHFDEDMDLSKIYRYLDKLNHSQPCHQGIILSTEKQKKPPVQKAFWRRI